MDSITINFNGDLHIAVSQDSALGLMKSADRRLREADAYSDNYRELVQNIGDFLADTAAEYEQYDNGADGSDIDSIVMVLRPGDVPKVMTESECYEAVERHGQFCSGITINEPDICAYGLKAAYDPRTILPLGDERYIIGPVIVYASDSDGDSISLDAEDIMAAIVYFDDHTVMLCADGKELPSFMI